MTGGKATLAPGAGNTIRFQGTIDDDSTPQKSVMYSDGSYALVSNGAGARITIGSASNPGGTVIFQGRTGYAAGTEMNSGMLGVDGNTGSIKSGSDLIFSGTSEFQYDNTNSSASADKTQTFGTLAFQDGEGTVTNIKGNALSTTLGFGTVTRATGATGNFVAAGGTNGGDNKILIGGAAGFRSPGLFFGGSNYATIDGSGHVRGFNYGVDANGVLSPGGSSISGTIDFSSNVKLGGAITAQTTAELNTLNLDSNDVTLGDGQTLTVKGILQSGGTNAISGGNGLVGGGSDGDLVIRTDTEVDFLTISTSITAPNLVKGGTGVLQLSGSNQIAGSIAIHSGVLIASDALVFPAGADVHLSPAALLVLNFSGTDTIDELYIGGVKQKAGTWGGEGSGATFTSSVIVGTGILAVTGGEVTFQGWASLNVLDGTTGKKSGATDDPDKDGVPNLLEFILGGEPLVASTNVLPTSSVSGEYLTLRFNRDDLSEAGVGLSVQTTTDFTTWTDIPLGASSGTPGRGHRDGRGKRRFARPRHCLGSRWC